MTHVLRRFSTQTAGSMATEVIYVLPAAMMLMIGAINGASDLLKVESARISTAFHSLAAPSDRDE